MAKICSISDCLPEGAAGLAVARFLAATIESADHANPNRWGLTVRDGWLRLNVGMAQAIVVGATIDISVMRGSLDQKVFAYPEVEDESDGEDAFASVPGSGCVSVEDCSARTMTRILNTVQQSHLEFVRAASTTARNPMTTKGHTPKAVRQLAKLVGRALPQPGYLIG